MPLRVRDGVGAWIDDFVNSTNERFKGKSKEERINQALGAFYSAKRDKAKNNKKESHTLSVFGMLGLSEVGGLVNMGTHSAVQKPIDRRWMGDVGNQVPGAGGPPSMTPGAPALGAGGTGDDAGATMSGMGATSTSSSSASISAMAGSATQPTQTGPGQLPNTITKVSPSKEDDYMGMGDRPDSLNRLYPANYGR